MLCVMLVRIVCVLCWYLLCVCSVGMCCVYVLLVRYVVCVCYVGMCCVCVLYYVGM